MLRNRTAVNLFKYCPALCFKAQISSQWKDAQCMCNNIITIVRNIILIDAKNMLQGKKKQEWMCL